MPEAAKSTEEFKELVRSFLKNIKKGKMTVDGCDVYPVYTMPNQMDQFRGSLQFLAKQVADEELSAMVDKEVIVLDVVRLLFCLNEKKTHDFQSRPYAVCEDDLTKSTYDFTMEALCDYHKDREVVCCALGLAKRICYLLSDVLCNVYGVEATDAHLPTSAPAEYTQVKVTGFGGDEDGPSSRASSAVNELTRRISSFSLGRGLRFPRS